MRILVDAVPVRGVPTDYDQDVDTPFSAARKSLVGVFAVYKTGGPDATVDADTVPPSEECTGFGITFGLIQFLTPWLCPIDNYPPGTGPAEAGTTVVLVFVAVPVTTALSSPGPDGTQFIGTVPVLYVELMARTKVPVTGATPVSSLRV